MSFKTPTPFLRGRTYYFRLRVPQDLLPVYDPKKELTFSLKTRDFHQALENARLRAIQLDQEFREHRRRLAEQKEQALAPAAAIAAAAALVLLAGQAGILSLPGFDRENSVTVNVGSAAERIFERIEPEAGEPDPAAAEEAAALSAETQLDVLLLWGQGTPAELRATPYETTKTGARLYRVTGTLAQELLDHYAAALYAADSDFSDLPEQEEACVLVME